MAFAVALTLSFVFAAAGLWLILTLGLIPGGAIIVLAIGLLNVGHEWLMKRLGGPEDSF